MPKPTNRLDLVEAVLTALAVGIATFVGIVIAAAAVDAGSPSDDLTIAVDVVDAGPTNPGTNVDVVTVDTTGLAGLECTVRFEARNNSSVWPGNNLYVLTSADAPIPPGVILAGVEDAPSIVVAGDRPLVLGDTVRVYLVVGPTGRYSVEGDITLEQCTPPAVVVVPSSTSSTPTTTSPPPAVTTTSIVEAPPAPPVPRVPDFTG